jgi:hypothetical protein
MRELFIVGIKLYGVINLFQGISSCFILIELAQLGSTLPGTAYSWLIPTAVSFLIVFAAVTQAERLADLFGLAEGSARFSGFSPKATLKVGLILIGVSYLLRTIPALTHELTQAADPVISTSPYPTVGALLQVLISLTLVLGSNKVIEFIEEHAV